MAWPHQNLMHICTIFHTLNVTTAKTLTAYLVGFCQVPFSKRRGTPNTLYGLRNEARHLPRCCCLYHIPYIFCIGWTIVSKSASVGVRVQSMLNTPRLQQAVCESGTALNQNCFCFQPTETRVQNQVLLSHPVHLCIGWTIIAKTCLGRDPDSKHA